MWIDDLTDGEREVLRVAEIEGEYTGPFGFSYEIAIYNYANNLQIPVWQAVECASATPARSIGMAKYIGSLAPGKYADIVLFDEDVNVTMTFRCGKLIFCN